MFHKIIVCLSSLTRPFDQTSLIGISPPLPRSILVKNIKRSLRAPFFLFFFIRVDLRRLLKGKS